MALEPIFPIQYGVLENENWLPMITGLREGGFGQGLALTAGTGLNVNITAGHAVVAGYVVSPGAATEALTASSTNYVFLNYDETFTVNTTNVQPSQSVFLGTVTTDGSGVTAVVNARTITSGFGLKLEDEAKDSSETTLAIDADLQVAVESGQIWELSFAFGLALASGSFTSAKLGIQVEAAMGAYGFIRQARSGVDGTGIANYLNDLSINGTGAQSFTPHDALAVGQYPAPGWGRVVVETNGASGNIGLSWAHGGSGADDLTLKAGSYLVARRIA